MAQQKIFGIGVDLIEVKRISKILKKNKDQFVKRIAHQVELEHQPRTSAQLAQYWASRFAVKEAFAKAMGTGIRKDLAFASVGVKNAANGAPMLCFDKKVARLVQQKKISCSHVSITHTKDFAIAMIVLEKK